MARRQRSTFRRSLIGVGGVLAVVVVAGCGSSSGTTSTTASTSTTSTAATAKSVAISSAAVSGLGTVLVNSQGDTLYIFEPDNHTKVTCTGGCAAVWPPVQLSSGQTPSATGAVKASLLGSDPNPSGGNVVTYAGWPLYTYAGDSGAGSASGQALDVNGGLWYVISPSGTVIRTTP